MSHAVSPGQPEAARLDAHAASLVALARNAVHPDGGFGWLDPDNHVVAERPVETWIHSRMTHVAALGVLGGDESLRPLLDVGYDGLVRRLRDADHGGWLPAVGGVGIYEATDTTKVAYAHAFVILAAASLTKAGHPGGRHLLDEALSVFDRYFFDPDAGLAREQYDRAWTTCEGYRGVNANMHTVEAYLAAGEVLGDAALTDRAVGIIERVIHGFARDADWRLPEHFDASWNVELDYNIDEPAHPFRPYGVTIGHLLEWSRLTLNARNALLARGEEPPAWMLDDAASLYEASKTRGWSVDGAAGFVYTTNFSDAPVVRERLHWVCCEAIAAAWALYEASGDEKYRADYDEYWAYALEHLVDHERGGWIHELSPTNEPSELVWWGKPDLYHAYQATLVPLLPGMVSFAGAASGR